MNVRAIALGGLGLFCLCACDRQVPPVAAPEHVAPPTNRIQVPDIVRRNLGIEFVRVERRRVAQTLRVSGHFELLPSARQELRAPVNGRVEVLVRPLQRLRAGDVAYRVDSPAWRQSQRELSELATQIRVLEARRTAMQPLVAAHRVHEESLREAAEVIGARVASLEETRASIGGQARDLAEARAHLAQVRSDLAEAVEKEAQTNATLAELEANVAAGRDRFQLALAAAAAIVAIPADRLGAGDPSAGAPPPWRSLTAVEVRAVADGIVDQLPVASGAWVEAGELVVTVSDLGQVRFRARGLQSDLPRLRTGLPCQVLPAGAASDPTIRVSGPLALGIAADPAQRTIDLFVQPEDAAEWAKVEWVRPGVAGFVEIETVGGREPELTVPLAATLQDGLQRVLFRRDPADGDQVIRLEADLGLDDGRWVEVKSGLRDGDEVVLAGAYELMLASSGSAPKGGHFHADGTFHADDHK